MRRILIALVASVLVAMFAACGDDGPSDQLQLNTVMVGAQDWLSADDSATVSAIGLELVALGAPLREWFEGTEDHEVLLDRMASGVDRIDARLAGAGPEVRATFSAYVTNWRDILDALGADDLGAYERAVARVQALDDERIARVVDVYGADEARRLLEEEGVDPNR